MGTTKTTYFFKDKPIFGFDIGHGSLKVMQMKHGEKKGRVIGYGTAVFNGSAIDNGVIVDHETIAKATHEMFKSRLIGDITTRRAVVAIPSYRAFTRLITLPPLVDRELHDAVAMEAAQYITMPLEDLYLDYGVIRRTADKIDLFAIAVPKKIVDSHLELMKILGIEAVGVATTIDAAGQLFLQDQQSDAPAVLIDFGSLSADISIFDHNLLVSGTVSGGGEIFTDQIANTLGVSQEEAHVIKTKYGLGASKKQKEILQAVEPVLLRLSQEIRRMIRYYEDRFGTDRKIAQVMTLGGGANMPGLSEWLTSDLRLAVRTCDPWEYCDFHGLQPPSQADKPMYATVMGLSFIRPQGLFT